VITIASGGSRGDFVGVDNNNGTLFLTQTDSVYRAVVWSGLWITTVTPEPGASALTFDRARRAATKAYILAQMRAAATGCRRLRAVGFAARQKGVRMNEIAERPPSPGGYPAESGGCVFARTFFRGGQAGGRCRVVDASNRAMLEVFRGACMQA